MTHKNIRANKRGLIDDVIRSFTKDIFSTHSFHLLTMMEALRSPLSVHQPVVDVIVVGAGQAGLAAAHSLFPQHSVVVLEASDHVGGRTRNFDLATKQYDVASDDVFELGGTWLSPHHTHALKLCKTLGIEVFNASFIPADDDQLVSNRTDEEDEYDFPWWFWGVDYSDKQMKQLKRTIMHMAPKSEDGPSRKVAFSSAKELFAAMNQESLDELERVGRYIDTDAASISSNGTNCWEIPDVQNAWTDLDSISTGERFLSSENELLKTHDARNILRNVIHNKNAQEPHFVSYFYNLISFKGCNSKGPDTQYRVRGGTQAVPLRIAELVQQSQESQLLLNAPVSKVSYNGKHVEVTTENGQVFRSRTIVVTGSPASAGNITFEPPLRNHQEELLTPDKMPMGSSMKFAAIYHKGPWWRKHDIQGDILSSWLPKRLSVDIKGESVPLFGYCFDLSPKSQRFGLISCFMEGDVYRHFKSLSQEQRQELMNEFLRLSFEDLNVGNLWQPDDFVVGDWGPATKYVGGAYTSYFPPQILSKPQYWDAYRQVEKGQNIFFAGADYHAGYGNGYIEGAIRSGQEAADLISKRLGSDLSRESAREKRKR